MTTTNITTSADLEAIEDIEGLESITEQCVIEYQPTEAELGWLYWLGDRYALSQYLMSTLSTHSGAPWSGPTSPDVLTLCIDVSEISRHLAADGIDRAPCLSEDTQLARLIWFIGPDLATN